MTAHVLPDRKSKLQIYMETVVDLVWRAAAISTIGFGAAVALIFFVGLAMNFDIIKVPPQLCHAMVDTPQLDASCK